MNRRQFLELAALASLGVCSACDTVTGASLKTNRKKGLGITTKTDQWRKKVVNVNARWFYSWGSQIPPEIPSEIEFVPMIFGKMPDENILKTAELARENRMAQMLGFNEPDQKHQSNIKVDQALEAWPALMKTGLRLGSPGCVHPDQEWMKTFMREVERRDLRVDFVCVHSYGGLNVGAFVKQMEQVYKLFGRPIWITEFAVGDWQAKTRAEHRYKPDQIVRFMRELLPRLNEMKIIERYAWFPAKPDNRALGSSALFNTDGSLTEVGETYRLA